MDDRMLEKLIDNLPYGFKALILPADEVIDEIRPYVKNAAAAQDAVQALSSVNVDISPLTDGLDEESKTLFTNLLMSLVVTLPDFGTAGMLAILLRKYLIPMAQRKQALEKMIIALGKEADSGCEKEAD